MQIEVTPHFWIPEHKTSVTGVEVVTPEGYRRGEQVIFDMPEVLTQTGRIFPYHICDVLHNAHVDPDKMQVKCEDKELSGTYVWANNKWSKEARNG